VDRERLMSEDVEGCLSDARAGLLDKHSLTIPHGDDRPFSSTVLPARTIRGH
jgi:hypothetical protein